MKQQDLYETAIKKQEERIPEMEQVISLLEEENRMLHKHADDYSAAMRQMLEDFQ